MEQAAQADSIERLMGFEDAGAAQYFSAFGECLSNAEFVFAIIVSEFFWLLVQHSQFCVELKYMW